MNPHVCQLPFKVREATLPTLLVEHLLIVVELFFGLSLVMRGLTALGESAINTAVYPLSR